MIKYKDRPLEFWDLKTLTFLREMVSNPPSFNCVEWTPLPHRIKSTQSKPDFSNGGGGGGGNLATVDFDVAMGATDSKMAQVRWRGEEGRGGRGGEGSSFSSSCRLLLRNS